MSLESLSRKLKSVGTSNFFVNASVQSQGVTAGTYSPDPIGAEIRRSRDNKLFRKVVETDNISALHFIKHLTQVCEQVSDALGEPCYIYWHGAKYNSENGKLKSAGTALRRFQDIAHARTNSL